MKELKNEDYQIKHEKQDRKQQLKQSNIIQDKTFNKQTEETADEHGKITNQNDIFKKGLLGLFQKTENKDNIVREKEKKQEQNALKKQEIKKNQRLSKLYQAIDQLNKQERLEKAIRHFYDAFYYQSVRHDIEVNKRTLVNFLYRFVNSLLWVNLLMIMNWFYIILTFFEPDSRFDQFNTNHYSSLLVIIGEGVLDGEIPYDQQLNNFETIIPAISILYSLVTIDLYPESMLAALTSSYIYLFYFIPYLLLTMMLLIPIPVSIVFEAFKKNQINIIMEDRLKQRSALFCCFVTLDFDDSRYMSEKTFKELMYNVYKYQLPDEAIDELYELIDENNSKRISIDEFFMLIDIIDENQQFAPTQRFNIKFFLNIKEFVNKKLKFRKILNSVFFSVFIFLITTLDCILIFISMSSSNSNLVDTVDKLGLIFLIIYSFEAVFKIFSLGLYTYFKDSWNSFDFFLILVSLVFQIFVFETLPIGLIRSASRFTRFRRIFRLAKALRSIKFINFFFIGFELFAEVKSLISKITLTLPIFFRLTSVLFIIIYLFSSFGVEIFSIENGLFHSYDQLDPFRKIKCDKEYLSTLEYWNWGSCEYATLDTFWGNNLLLFQVLTGSGWSYLIYESQIRIGSLFLSYLFYDVFHLLVQLVVVSLFKGIIWEIFSVVETSFDKEDDDILQEDEDALEGEFNEYRYRKRRNTGGNGKLLIDLDQNQQTLDDMTQIIGKNQKNIKSQKYMLQEPVQNIQTESNYTQQQLITNDENKNSPNRDLKIPEFDKIDFGEHTQGNSFFSIDYQKSQKTIDNVQKNNKIRDSIIKSKRDITRPIDFSKIQLIPQSHHSDINSLSPIQKYQSGFVQSKDNSFYIKILNQNLTQSFQHHKNSNFKNLLLYSSFYQEDEILDNQQIQIFDMGENLFEKQDFYKIFTGPQIKSSNQIEQKIIENSPKYDPQETFLSNSFNQTFHSKSPKKMVNPSLQKKPNNQVLQHTHFVPSKKYFETEENDEIDYSSNLENSPGFGNTENYLEKDSVKQNKDEQGKILLGNEPIKLKAPVISQENVQFKNLNNSVLNQTVINNTILDITKNQKEIFLQTPKQKFQETVFRVIKSLRDFEKFYFAGKFITYKMYSSNILRRKQKGEIQEFDEEEHVFQSDDEQCVATYIRAVYDEIGYNEPTSKKISITKKEYSQRFLLNKALLQSTDKKMMKELESSFFAQLYGNVYKNMRETDALPMIKTASKLTSYLNTVLKFSSVPMKAFFQILDGFEKKVTHTLLTNGSFCKFIYQTVNNVTFSLTFKNDKIKFIRIRDGFWKYHDAHYITNEKNIIIGKSILEGFKCNQGDAMDKFVRQLQILSSSVSSESHLIQSKDRFFDVVMTNHIQHDRKSIEAKLFEVDSRVENNKNNDNQASFLQQNQKNQDSSSNSLPTLQNEIIKNSVIKNIQFFILHNKNINRQKTPDLRQNSSKPNYQARKFIQKFDSQKSDFMSLSNQGEYNQADKAKQSSNEMMTFAYVNEFVKDIKKIIISYQQNFVVKASELFFERYKLEISNFLNLNCNKILEEDEDLYDSDQQVEDLKNIVTQNNLELKLKKNSSIKRNKDRLQPIQVSLQSIDQYIENQAEQESNKKTANFGNQAQEQIFSFKTSELGKRYSGGKQEKKISNSSCNQLGEILEQENEQNK